MAATCRGPSELTDAVTAAGGAGLDPCDPRPDTATDRTPPGDTTRVTCRREGRLPGPACVNTVWLACVEELSLVTEAELLLKDD